MPGSFHMAYFPRGKFLKISIKAGLYMQQKGIICPSNEYHYLHEINKGFEGWRGCAHSSQPRGLHGVWQSSTVFKPIPSVPSPLSPGKTSPSRCFKKLILVPFKLPKRREGKLPVECPEAFFQFVFTLPAFLIPL